MTSAAIIFMALSWTFVLGLTVWSFARVLRRSDATSSQTKDSNT
jgi:hypothetical protein